MLPVALKPLIQDECAAAPTFSSTPTLSDTLDTCAGGGGWVVQITFAITGSLGSYEFEVWRKSWEDAEAEPGSYTYAGRYTSAGTKTIETDLLWGSDGAGTSVTRRRKCVVRIVPGSSAAGSGSSCVESNPTSQLNRTGADCVE